MKKYKLIKTYPGSPCFGAEIIEAADIRGRYFIKRSDIWFINNPEKYPEFWEEVIEKNYEILSYTHNGSKHIWKKDSQLKDTFCLEDGEISSFTELKDILKYSKIYLIHSVKRLSDGEIFTIGDKVKAFDRTEVINKFYQGTHNSQKHILFWNLGYNIDKLVKIKQSLFKTEDGVDIFEGDDYYAINITFFNNYGLLKAFDKNSPDIRPFWQSNRLACKYFSTKEKVEEYILINKKSLSPNDILKVWSNLSGHNLLSLTKSSTLMAAILKTLKDENNKK